MQLTVRQIEFLCTLYDGECNQFFLSQPCHEHILVDDFKDILEKLKAFESSCSVCHLTVMRYDSLI